MKALKKKNGRILRFDISKPATNAKEAIQWLYFAYLAATKDKTVLQCLLVEFLLSLDIYIERDIKRGVLTEIEAQELIDHFVMKLRIIRFLRTQNMIHFSLVIQFG